MIINSTNFGSGAYDVPTSGTPYSVSSGTWSPRPNRLSVLMATVRRVNATDTTQITTVTGCGLTWTRQIRRVDTQGVVAAEIWTAIGPAPTAGAVTITVSNGRNTSCQLLNMDEDTILSTAGSDTGAADTAATSISLTAPSAPTQWVAICAHRANQWSQGTGQTSVELNVSFGTGGAQARSSVVALAPTANLAESIAGMFNAGASDWCMAGIALGTTAPFTNTPSTFNQRPYAASSVWNKKLSELYPNGIPIHPETNKMIRAIQMDTTQGGVDTGTTTNVMSMDTSQYTMPVYVINNSFAPKVVRPSDTWRYGSDTYVNGSYQVGEVLQLKLPNGPIYPAQGTDSQVIVINTDSGQEWNFFNCQKNPDGTWKQDANGHYLCQNVGRYDGILDGSAVPATTPKLWTLRGAGVPYMTGLVRKWEVAQGHIDHPIALAFDWPSGEFVAPASKSDGLGKTKAMAASGADWAPPEGARLRLKDSIDINAYSDPYARMLAVALREYGAIIIDNAGRPKFYGEYEGTASWGGINLDTAAAAIHIDHLEVINWNSGAKPWPYYEEQGGSLIPQEHFEYNGVAWKPVNTTV